MHDRGTGPVVRVFGGVGVTVDGEPVPIGGPQQHRLLALLVVRAGQVLSVDWLTEHLWSSDNRPGEPVPGIRTALSRLRSAVPDDVAGWIVTTPAGYRFEGPTRAVEHLHLAALRRQAAAAAREGDPATALALLDEALDLWTGEPFPELEDLDWARAETERLRIDRLEMQEERWEAALALGRHTQITGELAAFTAAHGLRERAVRQRAVALHRSGRTADALAVIHHHRRLLVEETGLDPSPQLVDLERALLTGDGSVNAGYRLRGYRLVAEAASGRFSVVWRAEQPALGRTVAIKQIRGELASLPDFIRRFETEARLVARVVHPHVVPLIDFWRDPDTAYLVMQWMPGGTLDDRVQVGPLTLDETLTVADDVCGALAAAHARGVVHRDVKPANILLDDDGNAFLGDFGIALQTSNTDVGATPSRGTPAYAAPEQRGGAPADPRSDVFSLGVVLLECLAGRDDGGETDRGSVATSLRDRLSAVVRQRGDVPSSVVTALARATAVSPNDRPATVTDLLADLRSGGTTHPGPVVPDADPQNPYVGLRAFLDADAARFFGRERLVAELVDRLVDGPSPSCVVLVGPSGCGKSSVARAGLVPALRRGAVPGSEDWFVTFMVPGDDPYAALEAALLRVSVDPPADLAARLRAGPAGVEDAIRACVPGDDSVLLLVLDQLEEVFAAAAPDTADRFLEAVAAAVTAPASPLRLVATVRADHYHQPLAHPSFAAVIKQAAVDVTPMSADELERAIELPARASGLRFDDGLTARIVADAVGRTGSLPLMQHVLTELFDRRDGRRLPTSAYEAMGGLAGALSARAESLHRDATTAERNAIRRLFGRLTTPSEERADVRRRVRVSTLGNDAAVTAVLHRFGDARLLTFDRDVATREPTVEVAHEALLREWPRLVAWLEEDRALLRSLDEIAMAADAWDRGDRATADLYRGGRLESAVAVAAEHPDRLRPLDHAFVAAADAARAEERHLEQRRVQRLRRLVTATAAALVVALTAAGVAVVQQRRADDEAGRAVAAAATATDATRDAELQTLLARSASLVDQDSDLAILLALEAHRRAPSPTTEGAVLNALGGGRSASKIASVPIVGDLDACPYVASDSTGVPQFGVVDGQLAIGGPLEDAFERIGPAPADCVYWQSDAARERWVAIAMSTDSSFPQPEQLLHGRYGQGWSVVRDLTPDEFLVDTAFLAGDRLAVVDFTATTVQVVDARTGDQVGTGAATSGRWGGGTINREGTRLAVGFGEPPDADAPGRLVVLEAATGDPVLEVPTDAVPVAMDFDERGRLVAVLDNRRVVWVDLVDGAVVRDARVSTTSNVQQLRVLDDSRVVVTSNSQVEVIDPSGEVPRIIPVRDVEEVAVTAEGRIRTTSSDDRWETYAIDGNAVTGAAIPVETRGSVVIDEDRAVVAWPEGGVAEVVELATGTRTALDVRPPRDGLVVAGLPWGDGIWVVGAEPASLSYWEAGEQQAEIAIAEQLFPTTIRRTFVAPGPSDDTRLVWFGETGLLVDLDPVDAEVIRRFGPGQVSAAVATDDGGVRAVLPDGVVLEVSPDNEPVGSFPTGELTVRSATPDPGSERFFLNPTLRSGIVVVDPTTRSVDRLSIGQVVSSIGVVDDGDTLVLTTDDGAVRLWDVEADRLLGIAYQGTGASEGTDQWYDPVTDTVWVVTAGQLLQLPLDPDRWVDAACRAVGRTFTTDEWERFVPGDEDRATICGIGP